MTSAGLHTLAILQARTSSTRLPGKVLAPLHGRPMILRQLERLQRSETLDRIVVATSVDPSDDRLSQTLESAGVEVRRGSLHDVFSRFAAVVDEFAPEHVVRLTADCPLADPAVIDRVVLEHLERDVDYTSNVWPPTFPHGLDVECVTTEAFRRLGTFPLTTREREHVTLGISFRRDLFSTANVEQSIDRSDQRWTVDVPEDLEFVREVYAELYDSDPSFGQAEILALLAAGTVRARTSADLERDASLRSEPGEN